MTDPVDRFDDETRRALGTAFFRALPAGALETLLGAAVPMRLPPGAILYRDGEAPRAGVVVDGLVRAYLSSPEGRQVTVRYARQGELLGLPLTVSGPGEVGAQAVTTARLLMFPVDVVRKLGTEDARVAWAVAEEISGNLWEVLDELGVHAFGTMRQRVARHLLDLATIDEEGRLVAAVTQREIAEAVGSVREVVARTLGELRKEGLVSSLRSGVRIDDAAGLDEASRLERA